MRVETLPSLNAEVGFPVEQRARSTVELLREIVPDVRRVLVKAGLQAPIQSAS